MRSPLDETRQCAAARVAFHPALIGNFTGDGIDRSHARKGRRVSLSPDATWSIGNHPRLSPDYNFSRLAVQGGRLYLASVTQSQILYQFSERMFIRAIPQFADIRRNIRLYDDPDIDPKKQTLFSQLLFSYKLNPGTVLFLGYSDNYHGNQDFSIMQTGRTLFAKIGYAWQL